MKYKFLTSHSPADLSKEVQKHLDDGWSLHGMSMMQSCESWGHFRRHRGFGRKNSEYIVYAQAVIKEEKENLQDNINADDDPNTWGEHGVGITS